MYKFRNFKCKFSFWGSGSRGKGEEKKGSSWISQMALYFKKEKQKANQIPKPDICKRIYCFLLGYILSNT